MRALFSPASAVGQKPALEVRAPASNANCFLLKVATIFPPA